MEIMLLWSLSTTISSSKKKHANEAFKPSSDTDSENNDHASLKEAKKQERKNALETWMLIIPRTICNCHLCFLSRICKRNEAVKPSSDTGSENNDHRSLKEVTCGI